MIQRGRNELPARIKNKIDIPSRPPASRVSPVVSFLPSPVAQDGRASDFKGDRLSLPYFRLWVDNWRASPRVQGMTYFQRGIFIEMLSLSWQMGPLPLNSLPILLKLNPRSWRIAWQFPLNSCWVETEEGLINERLEEERSWAKSKTDIGKRAAKHRWNIHADAMRMHSEGNAIPDPDPDPDIKKEKKDLVPTKKPVREEIPEGVFWHEEDGIQITDDWKEYLRAHLEQYGKALDKFAPSSAGIVLTVEDYTKTLEYMNGRILTDARLRPGPKSREPKWKQFRAFVRNQFVQSLLRKRAYRQKTSGAKGEPKSFQALKKSWEKLKDGD